MRIYWDLFLPIMRIDLENAMAYLLDGTDLGTIGNIKKLGITRRRRNRRK